MQFEVIRPCYSSRPCFDPGKVKRHHEHGRALTRSQWIDSWEKGQEIQNFSPSKQMLDFSSKNISNNQWFQSWGELLQLCFFLSNQVIGSVFSANNLPMVPTDPFPTVVFLIAIPSKKSFQNHTITMWMIGAGDDFSHRQDGPRKMSGGCHLQKVLETSWYHRMCPWCPNSGMNLWVES